MKRNESYLVYSVTGLLLVILFVAVVFGREGAQPSLAGESAAAKADPKVEPAAELADLMNLNPAGALADRSAQADAGAPPAAGSAPPVEPAAVPQPTAAEAAARQLELVYGASVRQGDFREVVVRPGDTLSQLVERWCGSLQAMPIVEALNEDLDKNRLKPGRKLLVPWVDDEVLLARRAETRPPAPATPPSKVELAQAPAAEPAAAPSDGDVKAYKLKPGDTLWGLAAGKTRSNGEAATYVARIMDLNPGLVPERLRPGQEIRLP